VSVVDRGRPVASSSEWHADGTAGEDGCDSGLAATVPARAMCKGPSRVTEPRGQAAEGGAAALGK
jgi:hypothetical protein